MGNGGSRNRTRGRGSEPPPLQEPKTDTLPPPWTRVWSNSKKRYYFYNETSGASRWTPPTSKVREPRSGTGQLAGHERKGTQGTDTSYSLSHSIVIPQSAYFEGNAKHQPSGGYWGQQKNSATRTANDRPRQDSHQEVIPLESADEHPGVGRYHPYSKERAAPEQRPSRGVQRYANGNHSGSKAQKTLRETDDVLSNASMEFDNRSREINNILDTILSPTSRRAEDAKKKFRKRDIPVPSRGQPQSKTSQESSQINDILDELNALTEEKKHAQTAQRNRRQREGNQVAGTKYKGEKHGPNRPPTKAGSATREPPNKPSTHDSASVPHDSRQHSTATTVDEDFESSPELPPENAGRIKKGRSHSQTIPIANGIPKEGSIHSMLPPESPEHTFLSKDVLQAHDRETRATDDPSRRKGNDIYRRAPGSPFSSAVSSAYTELTIDTEHWEEAVKQAEIAELPSAIDLWSRCLKLLRTNKTKQWDWRRDVRTRLKNSISPTTWRYCRIRKIDREVKKMFKRWKNMRQKTSAGSLDVMKKSLGIDAPNKKLDRIQEHPKSADSFASSPSIATAKTWSPAESIDISWPSDEEESIFAKSLLRANWRRDCNLTKELDRSLDYYYGLRQKKPRPKPKKKKTNGRQGKRMFNQKLNRGQKRRGVG